MTARNFLCRRHNVSMRSTSRFSFGDVFGEPAVLHLMREHNGALTVTPVGKPDAGNQHVGLMSEDEKRSELFRAQPPRPSSSLLRRRWSRRLKPPDWNLALQTDTPIDQSTRLSRAIASVELEC